MVNKLAAANIREEDYFRALYKLFEATLRVQPGELSDIIKGYRLRGIGANWDDNKWGYKAKIRDLERRLAEKDDSFVPGKD
jgi:hypothetical protein